MDVFMPPRCKNSIAVSPVLLLIDACDSGPLTPIDMESWGGGPASAISMIRAHATFDTSGMASGDANPSLGRSTACMVRTLSSTTLSEAPNNVAGLFTPNVGFPHLLGAMYRDVVLRFSFLQQQFWISLGSFHALDEPVRTYGRFGGQKRQPMKASTKRILPVPGQQRV